MTSKIIKAGHIPIVVLNWNGINDTVECIASILQMDYPDFKIYLLDNGSENSEGLQLQKRYASESRVEVRLIGKNLGFTHAHILIVEELRQLPIRFIALLNNDTVVDSNWLTQLAKVALSENAGVVSSKMIYYFNRNQLDNVGHQMLNTGEIVPIGYAASTGKFSVVRSNFGSCAGATLYSVPMIEQIGFFDPYFSTGYEDAEFGARAVVTGFKCVMAPDALVYHKVSRSVSKVISDDYELMIRNSIWYSYLKLMPKGVLFLSTPFILAKTLMLSLLNLATGRTRENRLMFKSIQHTFTRYRNQIRKSRRKFQQEHDLLSSLQILQKQRFFLGFDLQRVWKIWFAGNAELE